MAPAMATAGCAMTLTAGEASRDDFDHLQTDGRRVWGRRVGVVQCVFVYSYTGSHSIELPPLPAIFFCCDSQYIINT